MDQPELVREKAAVLGRLEMVRPPSVRFYQWVARRSRLPGFAAILVICLAPYLVGLVIALSVEDGIARHTVFWLRLDLFMMTAGAFILLDLIWKRALAVASEVIYPLRSVGEIRISR